MGTQLGLLSWGSVTKEDDLTLSLAPWSKYHSTIFKHFESRLKLEKKGKQGKPKHSPWVGELDGPLQVAQAWQLVLGLWKIPSHRG